MKTYIGFIRDHSGSMSHLAGAATKDYNNNIAAIKESSAQEHQDTIVSVVKCGVGYEGRVVHEVINSSVNTLKPLLERQYTTDGGSTPLFDSVGELIEQFQKLPDVNDPKVSFLIMAITDGQNNICRKYNATMISRKIQELQATDHWTFVFRVPKGYSYELTKMGIHMGNIQEWEQTQRGMETSSQVTTQAFKSYYTQRSAGKTSTKSFFETDLSNVSRAEIRSVMHEVTNEIDTFKVDTQHHDMQIRDFIEEKTKTTYVKGTAFYELDKTEKAVQDYKIILVKDKKSAKIYSGIEARTVLGLPTQGTIKLVPGDHGNFKIFIQSTSVNRKVKSGTSVLHWPNVN